MVVYVTFRREARTSKQRNYRWPEMVVDIPVPIPSHHIPTLHSAVTYYARRLDINNFHKF